MFESKILQAWYVKRTWFLVIAAINISFYLFEYSAVTISAFSYFKFTLKVENPKLYYSLTTGAMFAMAPFSSVYIGRYVDRTRNLRHVTIVLSFFNLFGNILYILPIFSWFPILGRFFCGFPSGMRPAFTGMSFLPTFVW